MQTSYHGSSYCLFVLCVTVFFQNFLHVYLAICKLCKLVVYLAYFCADPRSLGMLIGIMGNIHRIHVPASLNIYSSISKTTLLILISGTGRKKENAVTTQVSNHYVFSTASTEMVCVLGYQRVKCISLSASTEILVGLDKNQQNDQFKKCLSLIFFFQM